MGIGFRFRRQGATGKDIAKIEGDFRRMTEKGIEEVSKDMVNSLRENILAVRGIWRGDLIDSVEAKKLTRNMIAVKMKYYGWMLDKGHNIPPAASGSPYLRAWAYDKLPRPKQWLEMVKKGRIIKGADGKDVEGRGFVAPAVEQTAQKVQTIMKDNLRRVK